VRRMVLFTCPYCRAEYELTTASWSFQQLSYATCQVCSRTMCSWSARSVPRFTFMRLSEGKTSDPGVRVRAPLAAVSQETRSRAA
jgi:hypothetical protein